MQSLNKTPSKQFFSPFKIITILTTNVTQCSVKRLDVGVWDVYFTFQGSFSVSQFEVLKIVSFGCMMLSILISDDLI
ncbi:DUF3986 family protein [Bacillus sonorensis]|uniref:DUF3986 family protein n=1 Tax=Bacillus sonorensis TaxID=119858 RepID=UPI0035637DE9